MPETKSPEQILEDAWLSIDASDAPLDVRLAKFVERARDLVPWLMSAYDSFIDRIAQAGSGGDTPGLIPNPEVKPTYVLCGTVVREPTGSLAPSGVVNLWPRYGSWLPAASANGCR